MNGIAGFNMILKIGGSASGEAKDVDFNKQADEIDTTTRSSGGWKEFIQGLKEWDIDAGHLYVPSDAQILALQNAFLNGTVVAVEVEDPDGNNWSGNAIVTNISDAEPLDNAVMISVTLKGTGALTYTPAAS